MEQMEILLTVPTISKTTVSSTPKSTVTDDDQSFADLYQQNVNESKASNSESTQKNSQKENESVDNSAKSEAKVETTNDEKSTEKTDVANENVTQNIAAVNWLNIIDVATDSNIEVPVENVSEPVILMPSNEEAGITATDIETQSVPVALMSRTINDSAIKDNKGDMEVDVPTEMFSLSDKNSELVDVEAENTDDTIFVPTNSAQTQVSDSMSVDGLAEETKDTEIAVNTVQSEVATQSTSVAMKQTTDTKTTSGEFSAMTADDIPQSNLQESVMTQIENSLGKIVKTGNNEIRIQLEPEQLGVLNIRVITGKDGTQIVFKADSHQSSQLIAGQTDTLKTMLSEAGIKVDQIVVNDFSFSQENYQDQQTFEQQNSKSNKFYKGMNQNPDQIETYDAGYELPQTIVGLNYLI